MGFDEEEVDDCNCDVIQRRVLTSSSSCFVRESKDENGKADEPDKFQNHNGCSRYSLTLSNFFSR